MKIYDCFLFNDENDILEIRILKKQGFNIISQDIKDTHPKSINHLLNLSEREEFSSVMGSYLDWYK